MGKSLTNKKRLSSCFRSNSMVLVTGDPRSGKTLETKNLVNQLGHRCIIQFDYSGEWALSKFPNIFSRGGNWGEYLPQLINLEDIGFDISDYDNKLDWKSVGMTDPASQTMSYLARTKGYHQNDWEKFKEMVFELGNIKSKGDLLHYNKKYGTKLKATIHRETYKSIQKVMVDCEHIFCQDYTKYNFNYLLGRYNHININLQLNQGNLFSQRSKARLLVGKILEKLVPILRKYKPVLVFEECDILIPKLKEGDYYSSADWIKQYILKIAQRSGCLMFFIVQNPERCDDVIITNYNYWIRHEYTKPFDDRGVFSLVPKLKDNSNWNKLYFKPMDVSSQFENYPAITRN